MFAIGSVFKFFKNGGAKNILKFFGRDVEAVTDADVEMNVDAITILDNVTDDTSIINDGLPILLTNEEQQIYDWENVLNQLNQIIDWANSDKSYIKFEDEKYTTDNGMHPSK